MLENLNEQQISAVKTTDGPLLVIAGAGSGKTKVLTTRIAYIIENKNINPYNILAITFTNKAAHEMKGRIIDLIGPKAYDMQISTFHSFGLKILKENCKVLGFDDNFTIIDSDDSLVMIKKILKDLNLDVKEYNPKNIRSQISGAKNSLFLPDEYSKYVHSDFEEKVLEVYKRYQKRLKTNNSFDFDDLLMMPIVLFRKNPDVLKKYQDRFKYVLIDEYQDTNEAQYLLTKMISAKYKNICVVGDECQAIYSWRGSDYRNILNFESDYSNSKVILLEKNYRSTKTILNIANNVIKNNKQRKDKNLWTENEDGEKAIYKRCCDEKEEAYYCVEEIKKLINNNEPLNEIAVLYRTNAQSRTIEEALLRENIPYKVVGSFYFYNRKEIKDLISYLKVIYNQNDDLNLLRIINVPKRGIGEKTINNLVNFANINGTSIYDSIQSGKELEFKNLIGDLIKFSENNTLTELIDLILDKSEIRKQLESEKTIEADTRLENLEEFKTITKNFELRSGIISLGEFLEEISLVSDIEEHKDNNNVVTLMTVHSAKGLEFNHVFIVGLEERIFPHNNSLFSDDEIEEERRLFYVALTRAKRKLWLINTKRRMLYGIDSANPPSRFINEIDDSYLDIKDINTTIERQSITIDADVTYQIGEMINHETFGTGVCIGVENRMITVAFPHPYGIKKVIKGHKSIRKVDL